jgi:hypothetical protein
MKMRYRQPFHEKLENTVVRGSSDDAGGVGARGGSRAGARACAGAGARACVRVCAGVWAGARACARACAWGCVGVRGGACLSVAPRWLT